MIRGRLLSSMIIGGCLNLALERPDMYAITRRRTLALTLAIFTSLFLVPPVVAQEQEEEALRQEIQSLVEVVEAAVQGQLVPTERLFGWQNDFLKGAEAVYVPYTLVIDPGLITSPSVVVYVLVTERAETPEPATTERQNEERETQEQAERVQGAGTVFEDAYRIDVDTSESVAHRISRSFTVPGGEYNVYVAVKETNRPAETDEPARVMMLREQVTVPDFWTDQLATSSIMITECVEPLAAPLSEEEQVEDPYTIGLTRIIPVSDSTFAGDEDLSLVFLVYNSRLTLEGKPDVTVEYSFHQRTSDGETYFNRTTPQNFNAQTLPPTLDLAAGHQLVAGQSVPLSLFPEGAYRLEIKVTDNRANVSVTQDVTFTVGGP